MINFLKKYNFTGCTVILPSIGVGNVSQLSVDLIISTLCMEKIGIIWHPAIIQIMGQTAYEHDDEKADVTTACDLYYSDVRKLLIFQIRSPLVPTLMADFFNELSKWLKKEQIEQLIILTSSHAYEKHLIESLPFEHIANDEYKKYNETKLKSLNWIESSAFDDGAANGIIHGSGYAMKLMNVTTEHSIKTLILYKYISEGDNRPDAFELVTYLNRLLNIFSVTSNDENDNRIAFTIPISWSLLYGNDAPENIY